MKNLNDFIGLTKGVITIIGFNQEEYKKENLKSVIATCKCSRCGKTFKYALNSIRRSELFFTHNCPECKESYRIEQIEKRLKGKTKGILHFICFDHFDQNTDKAFVKCKCLRCGKEVIVRDDRFSKSSDPRSCTHCYPDYISNQVKQRYENIHGLVGEDYEIDKNIRYRIQSLKSGAKQRNLSFDISDEYAKELLKQPCYYCGSSNYIGLDRIDSSIGYTEDNCVPCCKYCNLMKNNISYNLFLTQISKIFKYRISNSTTIESTDKSGSE